MFEVLHMLPSPLPLTPPWPPPPSQDKPPLSSFKHCFSLTEHFETWQKNEIKTLQQKHPLLEDRANLWCFWEWSDSIVAYILVDWCTDWTIHLQIAKNERELQLNQLTLFITAKKTKMLKPTLREINISLM